ncbi:glycosyltransferase [Anopheles sinensis]|uniref:Glycosyltransferase n=1 Tax=Anopheles sinensis TaxID=74873 RepID=A0A084VBM5_ANOSI|nr:glycosyltransferase [Anopheles sinensis]
MTSLSTSPPSRVVIAMIIDLTRPGPRTSQADAIPAGLPAGRSLINYAQRPPKTMGH